MIAPRSIADSDFEAIAHLVPDPEPALSDPPGDPGAPERPLRVCEPLLGDAERRYLAECIETNWISSAGPFVRRFEAAFAERVGCEHGVACSSGTTALHLALAAAGVEEGDEVILPAFTMVATANAVMYLGATPVLVDSEPDTGNLDVEEVEAVIASRTRALLPVHVYGHPVEADGLEALAARHDLVLVEDAAEAHGALYRGRPIGSLGAAAAFSFFANKIVTTGEGGMVTTNDARIAARARELRDLSFSKERHFWHRSVAFNYRMTSMQAAIGLGQTERLDELVGRRRANARLYAEGLAGVPGVELPGERPDVRNVFWMYAIRVTEEYGASRDELRRRLAARGIETRTFFVPIHLQPAYHELFAGQRFPVAEELGRTGLYLPSGPGLTPDDIAYVVREVERARG